MFVKKIKEKRDSGEIGLFNSFISYIEAKFEYLFQRFRIGNGDGGSYGQIDVIPRHLSLS